MRSTSARAWGCLSRPGEAPIDAVRRELAEEVGLDWSNVEVLAEHPEWLGYELPAGARSGKTGRGQVHKWFLLRYLGGTIDLGRSGGREFSKWRWVPFALLEVETWPVRQPVYRHLASTWSASLEAAGSAVARSPD
jgi:putative (di)nucleoside polyphosphate hydrolase